LQILFGGAAGYAIERHAGFLNASEIAATAFDAARAANDFRVKGFHIFGTISEKGELSTTI